MCRFGSKLWNLTSVREAEVAQSVKRVGYGLDDQGIGFRFQLELEILLHSIQTGSGAHPAPRIKLVPGAVSRGMNFTSAEVENMWSYTSKFFIPPASCWFVSRLILRPRRWRRHVPPKCPLIFNGLRAVISQKIELFNKCIYL
jgi:hypothetical protein